MQHEDQGELFRKALDEFANIKGTTSSGSSFEQELAGPKRELTMAFASRQGELIDCYKQVQKHRAIQIPCLVLAFASGLATAVFGAEAVLNSRTTPAVITSGTLTAIFVLGVISSVSNMIGEHHHVKKRIQEIRGPSPTDNQ